MSKLDQRFLKAKASEDLVAQYLKAKGFQEVCRNFRRLACELDLVFLKNNDLLIVEVKARRIFPDDICQIIPPRKLQALWRGINALLQENQYLQPTTIHLGLALVHHKSQSITFQDIQWWRLPSPVE